MPLLLAPLERLQAVAESGYGRFSRCLLGGRWTAHQTFSAILRSCDAVGLLERPMRLECLPGRSRRFNQASWGAEKWWRGFSPERHGGGGPGNGCGGRVVSGIYATMLGVNAVTIANAISSTNGPSCSGRGGGA